MSTDRPREIAKGHKRHNLGATMLSDRDLAVTNRFGLRNTGIHSGPPPPIAPTSLPVPTSLLVDRDGTVLWMDQSENYQRRSDPDYVLEALRDCVDRAPTGGARA